MSDVQPRPWAAVLPLLAAPVLAFGLAAFQVVLGQVTGLLTLDETFGAGGERVIGVVLTQLIWYTALSVVVAVYLSGRFFPEAFWSRLGAVRSCAAPLAGLGVLLATPIAEHYAVIASPLPDEVASVMRTGAVLGAIAATTAALVREIGLGVAAHAALLWAEGVLLGLVGLDPLIYAGVMWDFVLPELFSVNSLPDIGSLASGWGLARMAPTILLLTILAAVLARRVSRSTRSAPRTAAAVLAGPVLALFAYLFDRGQIDAGGWNYSGAEAAVLIVLLAGAVAIIETALARTVTP